MQANILVAIHAQGEQILLGIVAQTAAWVEVMNLELGRTAAVLAAPPVPLQYLLAQLTIGLWVERRRRGRRACSGCGSEMQFRHCSWLTFKPSEGGEETPATAWAFSIQKGTKKALSRRLLHTMLSLESRKSQRGGGHAGV